MFHALKFKACCILFHEFNFGANGLSREKDWRIISVINYKNEIK